LRATQRDANANAHTIGYADAYSNCHIDSNHNTQSYTYA
jgi:hypothetical protein